MSDKEFKSVAVFCGASIGSRPAYAEAATALGKELVRRGIRLVYGGGNVGLMGIVSSTVMESTGDENSVVGVIPRSLSGAEISGQNKGDTRIVDNMHQRKALMAELSEGFVCLPGGFGTLEEVLEMITWQQLGLSTKPVGLLNCEGYFDKLLEFFDHSSAEGFIRETSRNIVISSSDPSDLLDKMLAYTAPVGLIQAVSSGSLPKDVRG